MRPSGRSADRGVPDRLPPGYAVLVTRPRTQGDELTAAIRDAGGEPVEFPVIEIRARDPAAVAADAAALPVPDVTIFVSSNAVQHGIEYGGGRLAAIGPATAAEIRRRGRTVDIEPASGFDSESLLAVPAFADIRGRAVRIVRGNAGRELLAAELARRGARVDYLAAYTRALPAHPPALVEAVAGRWRRGDIRAVIVMSVESLDNLARLLPADCLPGAAGPLLVTPAARVLKEFGQRYPGCPRALADGPRARELLDCIVHSARASAPPGPPD